MQLTGKLVRIIKGDYKGRSAKILSVNHKHKYVTLEGFTLPVNNKKSKKERYVKFSISNIKLVEQ